MESSTNSLSSTSTVTSSSNKPSTTFANLFLNEINHQDIYGLLDVQRSLLEQMDKSNEKLDGTNKYSAKHYADAQRDFLCHTQLLTTMKNDLDLIFKRIKLLKTRLSKKYPTAYSTVMQMNSKQNDPLDDDEDPSAIIKPSSSEPPTVDSSALLFEIDENPPPSGLNPE